MADTMTVRITGPVLRVDNRSGTKRDGSGDRYSIDTVRVLVESTGIAEATLPDSVKLPIVGEAVDYLVDVSVWNGRLQGRVLEALDPAA